MTIPAGPDPNCPDCLGEGGCVVSFDPPMAFPCMCTFTAEELADLDTGRRRMMSDLTARPEWKIEPGWDERRRLGRRRYAASQFNANHRIRGGKRKIVGGRK